MSQQSITPIILCGGSGTRLWPLSRTEAPKPFLPLIGERTLFQQALARTSGNSFTGAIIVTGDAQARLVEEQSEDAPIRAIIVEPEPKGTAAAIALAACRVPADEILLVCPSDHHIANDGAFNEAIRKAANLAAGGWLVCLGVNPENAATRFGYIRRGEALDAGAYRAKEFVEKPGSSIAEAFFASGDFAWNSGIFAFRAGEYLAELERFRPSIALAARSAAEMGRSSAVRFDPDSSAWSRIEPEPVDVAVMERTDRAAVVMTDPGWSDVGDWMTLYSKRPKDSDGNSVRGPAELLDCSNVLVDSDGLRIHLLGLEDVIVVAVGGDLLVARSGHAHEVAKLSGAKQRRRGAA